jgi:hypothetical protein
MMRDMGEYLLIVAGPFLVWFAIEALEPAWYARWLSRLAERREKENMWGRPQRSKYGNSDADASSAYWFGGDCGGHGGGGCGGADGGGGH